MVTKSNSWVEQISCCCFSWSEHFMHKRSFCDFHAPFQIAISVNSVCFFLWSWKINTWVWTCLPPSLRSPTVSPRCPPWTVGLWWPWFSPAGWRWMHRGRGASPSAAPPVYTPRSTCPHPSYTCSKWDCESTGLHFNKSHEKMNFYQSFEKCSIHSPDIRKQPETTENK